MGNIEEISSYTPRVLPLSFGSPRLDCPISRDAEARMHNFMMDDAAYRLRRDNDFCRPICIIEQSVVPRRDV